MSLDNSDEYQNKSNFLSNPGSGSCNVLDLNEDYFTEEYEKDEELDLYLNIQEEIDLIYYYIKDICNPEFSSGNPEFSSGNTIFPLFDKLSKSELMDFLYSDIEIDDKFFF